MKRYKLRTLSGMAVVALSALSASAQKQAQRPNIILILADDMGYSDIGCFGSEIRTPNLDRLASEGIRMTQFYNASRSCPTRASLLTGLYQHQAGVGDMVNDLGVPEYQGYINKKCVTLAEALKYNGYNTYMSGKWHVGGKDETLPFRRGFDRYFGTIDGAGSYFQRIPYRTNQAAPRWMMDSIDYNPPDTGFYMTDAITGNAVRFLSAEKGKNDPFFLYLAYTAPHWPLHALPADIARYKGKYMQGWDDLRKVRYKKMLASGIIDASVKLSPPDAGSKDWSKLSEEDRKMWDLRMAVYAAMIDRMDQGIGKVINELKSIGEAENTVIMFLADNGGCHEAVKNKGNYIKSQGETGNAESFDSYEIPWANASNTPFRMFKHWVHEGGISTPFIIWYPHMIKGGRIISQPAHITDLMPTILGFAEGKYPESFKGHEILPMEGLSLIPLFTGQKLKRDKPIFWEHEGNRAVRLGDWKLVSSYNTATKKFNEWELYNMHDDRSELNNLASKNPEIKYNLIELYCDWEERVGVIPKDRLDNK
jgi:arylsulfatase